MKDHGVCNLHSNSSVTNGNNRMRSELNVSTAMPTTGKCRSRAHSPLCSSHDFFARLRSFKIKGSKLNNVRHLKNKVRILKTSYFGIKGSRYEDRWQPRILIKPTALLGFSTSQWGPQSLACLAQLCFAGEPREGDSCQWVRKAGPRSHGDWRPPKHSVTPRRAAL